MNLNYRKRLHLLGTIAHCQYSQEFGMCINCWWVVVNITNILVE